jgi:two-component system chemotaxis response regulator CheB
MDHREGEELVQQLPPTLEPHDPDGPKTAQRFAGAKFDVVALAASAGGIAAISHILESLPAGFPAAIVVVQHLDPRHRSLMAEILQRRTPLDVVQAADGDRIRPGTVYIAPPDRHLLVNRDASMSLSQSELVHFVRPSADLLFESVAASYQARAIAVVLTGTGSDGSFGIAAIKKMGGTVIAQDQDSAEFSGMPGAAIKTGHADFILRLDEIPSALTTLVAEGVPR